MSVEIKSADRNINEILPDAMVYYQNIRHAVQLARAQNQSLKDEQISRRVETILLAQTHVKIALQHTKDPNRIPEIIDDVLISDRFEILTNTTHAVVHALCSKDATVLPNLLDSLSSDYEKDWTCLFMNNIFYKSILNVREQVTLSKKEFPDRTPCISVCIEGMSNDTRNRIQSIREDIHKIRQRTHSQVDIAYPVRLISWLIAKRSRLSLFTNESDSAIAEKEVRYISHIDPNTVIHDPESPVFRFIDMQEFLRLGFDSIHYSFPYMKQYISTGTLPQLGLAIIPNDVFFQNDNITKTA